MDPFVAGAYLVHLPERSLFRSSDLIDVFRSTSLHRQQGVLIPSPNFTRIQRQ
ncbi:hypothetical protein ACP70R_024975 [Stipagrostis hirtigluma subsp. patula]